MSRHADIVAEIPRLRRYARALTGDATRADDLVQDTLERALGKWPLWRPGNLRAWLFAIMHNLFVNQMRSPRVVVYPGDEAIPEMSTRATQTDVLELHDLARSLSLLNVDQREVLLLVGLEALSYEDTARILGVPIGTVMSRLSRGRERLRVLLTGCEPAETHLRVVK
ncbi:MAG: sigma-70 family RNA polymerase sigma factor [Rhodocyclaceae bacterium]|jgi:RNA polymerase sigma-70 factor (ECF subfamily)|nr:sigma-70 family RNA polymerase sigma factor [Rhodocyclaceae bacterium]